MVSARAFISEESFNCPLPLHYYAFRLANESPSMTSNLNTFQTAVSALGLQTSEITYEPIKRGNLREFLFCFVVFCLREKDYEQERAEWEGEDDGGNLKQSLC